MAEAEAVEVVAGEVPTEVEVPHMVVVEAMAHRPIALEAGTVGVIVLGEDPQVGLDIPLIRFYFPEFNLKTHDHKPLSIIFQGMNHQKNENFTLFWIRHVQ